MTWEDQQNINTFSKLSNRRRDLETEIAAAEVRRAAPRTRRPAARLPSAAPARSPERNLRGVLCVRPSLHRGLPPSLGRAPPPLCLQKRLEDLDDAGAELVLADDGDGDDGCVRMLVGAAFLHTPKDAAEAEVERLTEEGREALAKLREEQSSVCARLAELKVVLYGRLGSSNINLEE